MDDMTLLHNFSDRLRKIGIDVELYGNFPWIYIVSINGKEVKEKLKSDHGFTAFWYQMDEPVTFTNRREVFKLIRKYVESE
jgi:hypothetical protein